MPVVSDQGLPSNNAEEADELLVEGVKLDDRVGCTYDDKARTGDARTRWAMLAGTVLLDLVTF